MDLTQILDTAISDMLQDGVEPSLIARFMLDEGFHVYDPDTGDVVLFETVVRRVRMINGVRKTMMKTGRPSGLASARMTRINRRTAIKRSRTMKLRDRTAAGRRTKMVMARFRRTRPSAPKPRRHGPPRRGRRF